MDSLRFNRPESLKITASQWQEMQLQVDGLAPEEACGLLGGSEGRVRLIVPVTNILHSPVRYRMDAQEQWNAFMHMDEKNLELLGIYHSHPQGPDIPSPTDSAEAYYPEAVYLIWSRASGKWKCQGFSIQNKEIQEVEVLITENE